jgi:hypothetical protein
LGGISIKEDSTTQNDVSNAVNSAAEFAALDADVELEEV